MENSLGNQFDRFIRESLEDLQAPYDPTSWDQLEQRMDLEAIDEAARAAVGNLAVPYDPATWDRMEMRLDQELVTEVDGAARDAVSNLSVPYNPATWQILSDRLDRIDYRRKLIALKVVEAALILLAIITAVRFIQGVPGENQPTESSQDQVQQMAFLNEAGNTATSPDAETHLQKADETHTANPSPTIEPTRAFAVIGEDSRGDQAFRSANRVVFELAPIGGKTLMVTDMTRALNVGHADGTFAREKRSAKPLSSIAGKALAVQSDRSNLTRDVMAEALVGLPTLDVPMIMHEDMPISLAAVAPKLRKTKILTTRLGLYRQFSEHAIRQIHTAQRINQEVVTNGGTGLTTSIQSGMLGFDFGVGYEHLEFAGERSLMNVHKVQVPVNLRVLPVSNRYFDVYLKGGATAHGSIYANYEQPLAARSANKYNEKFNGGLLTDDGNTRTDMYFSLNYAIGTEIKLLENWSIFMEAMLQQHLSGHLGHNEIIINSRSIAIGINKTL